MTQRLYGWGYNLDNQFGIEGLPAGQQPVNYNYPVKINDVTTWSKVALGSGVGFAIKTDGTLYYAGLFGWFGYPELNYTNDAPRGWVQVGSSTWSHISVFSVASGLDHAFGIKTNGTLWFVGQTNTGLRGNGETTVSSVDWVQIGVDTDWEDVATGGEHVAAVKAGKLYTWGSTLGTEFYKF